MKWLCQMSINIECVPTYITPFDILILIMLMLMLHPTFPIQIKDVAWHIILSYKQYTPITSMEQFFKHFSQIPITLPFFQSFIVIWLVAHSMSIAFRRQYEMQSLKLCLKIHLDSKQAMITRWCWLILFVN